MVVASACMHFHSLFPACLHDNLRLGVFCSWCVKEGGREEEMYVCMFVSVSVSVCVFGPSFYLSRCAFYFFLLHVGRSPFDSQAHIQRRQDKKKRMMKRKRLENKY